MRPPTMTQFDVCGAVPGRRRRSCRCAGRRTRPHSPTPGGCWRSSGLGHRRAASLQRIAAAVRTTRLVAWRGDAEPDVDARGDPRHRRYRAAGRDRTPLRFWDPESRVQIDPQWEHGAAPFRLIAADGTVIEESADAGRGTADQARPPSSTSLRALDSEVLPIAGSAVITALPGRDPRPGRRPLSPGGTPVTDLAHPRVAVYPPSTAS